MFRVLASYFFCHRKQADIAALTSNTPCYEERIRSGAATAAERRGFT